MATSVLLLVTAMPAHDMRMVARAVLGIALAIALIALVPGRAAACLCGTPEEGRANAQVVFTGVVAGVEDPSFPGWSASTGDPILYTFAIEEVISGSTDEFTVVRSTRNEGSGSCAIDMAIGERWEIYASFGEGNLWTSSCSGSQRLAAGVPASPVPGSTPPAVLFGAAAIAIAWLGGAGWLVARWRRQAPTRANGDPPA
jgi:hypothetical protein